MVGEMTSSHPKSILLKISNPDKMSLCQWWYHKFPRGDIYLSGSQAGFSESVLIRTCKSYC